MFKVHDNGQDVANAAGQATITFFPSFDEDWHVERIYAETDGALAPDVTVYVGSVAVANAKDISIAATRNIADEAQPIYVPGGSKLVVRFTGATVGSINTVSIQYRPETLSVDTNVRDALAGSPTGIDSMLVQVGFPNQVRMPREKR